MEKFREKKEKKKSETYTLEQVQKVALCVTSGILGLGKQEFVKIIEELPEALQRTILAACLSAKVVQKEMSEEILKEIMKITDDQND